jgi:hypothetical protein
MQNVMCGVGRSASEADDGKRDSLDIYLLPAGALGSVEDWKSRCSPLVVKKVVVML